MQTGHMYLPHTHVGCFIKIPFTFNFHKKNVMPCTILLHTHYNILPILNIIHSNFIFVFFRNNNRYNITSYMLA